MPRAVLTDMISPMILNGIPFASAGLLPDLDTQVRMFINGLQVIVLRVVTMMHILPWLTHADSLVEVSVNRELEQSQISMDSRTWHPSYSLSPCIDALYIVVSCKSAYLQLIIMHGCLLYYHDQLPGWVRSLSWFLFSIRHANHAETDALRCLFSQSGSCLMVLGYLYGHNAITGPGANGAQYVTWWTLTILPCGWLSR